MSLNASYAPQESSADYWNEVTHLAGGTVVCGFAYGILFTLYVLCLDAIIPQIKKKAHRNWAIFHIVYLSLILALIGAGTASNARLVQLIWVDNRNYPGGPAGFINHEQNIISYIWGWSVYVLASWLQDSYVIYRCLVFWDWSIWIMFLPLLLLASVGTSIALLVETRMPSQGVFGPLTLDFAICWYIFSISINVIATIAIVGRLLWKRRAINAVLGEKQSQSYTGPVAMLIESAAMYSVVGIIFIGCYFRQNPAGYVILPLLGTLEGISPIMIIYRISIGRGWTHNTLRQVNSTFAASTIRFDARPNTTTNTSNLASALGNFGSELPTETHVGESGTQKGSDVALGEKGL